MMLASDQVAVHVKVLRGLDGAQNGLSPMIPARSILRWQGG